MAGIYRMILTLQSHGMGQIISSKVASHMSIIVVFLEEKFQDNETFQTGICHVTLTQLQLGQISSTFLKGKTFGCGIIAKSS